MFPIYIWNRCVTCIAFLVHWKLHLWWGSKHSFQLLFSTMYSVYTLFIYYDEVKTRTWTASWFAWPLILLRMWNVYNANQLFWYHCGRAWPLILLRMWNVYNANQLFWYHCGREWTLSIVRVACVCVTHVVGRPLDYVGGFTYEGHTWRCVWGGILPKICLGGSPLQEGRVS